VSSASLNNNDIRLVLEYLGTSGSSLASFTDTMPSALTTVAAVPTSTATWNSPPGGGYTTWNPGDISGTTLSGGNLVASVTGSNGGVRSIAVASGKVYFELTFTNNTNVGIGIANASANLTNGTNGGTNTAICNAAGFIYVNQWSTSAGNLGSISNGEAIGIALDTAAQLIWFRRSSISGNWNGGAGYNPATGTGGISVSSIATGPLYALVYGVTTTTGVITANFGASAFVGAAPAGFSALASGGIQHLQVTFTPQQAGRLRGLVRLGKASTTVFVNPQITVT